MRFSQEVLVVKFICITICIRGIHCMVEHFPKTQTKQSILVGMVGAIFECAYNFDTKCIQVNDIVEYNYMHRHKPLNP